MNTLADVEKITAFDALSVAFTHRWSDGGWSWWCCMPSGGPKRSTSGEALTDLLAWAEQVAAKRRRSLTVNEESP